MKNRTSLKTNYNYTIYGCYVAYVVQAIINNLSPLLFSTYEKSLDISVGKIGILITVNFGVQIITDTVAAKYVDRIGYRIAMCFAHIASGIGLIGMGTLPLLFSDAYVGLLLASIINAIGGGLLEVLVSPIVEAAPESHGKAAAMSLLHSFYCWGQVAVVMLSTITFQIIGIEHWYYIPIIWAIIPLVNLIMFTQIPINILIDNDERITLGKLVTTKIFWLLCMMMICAGASEMGMSQWASIFAEDGLKVSKTIGDLLGPCAFAALMGLARLIYGKFGAKINLQRFILCSSVLCIVSYSVAIFAYNPVIALLGCATCGFSVGIMWPGTFSIAAKECSKGGTALFALLALAGDVGCAAGPGVVSVASGFYSQLGLKAGLLYAIIFPIIMSVLILILLKYNNKSC